MNSAYGPLGSFRTIFGQKYIGHNTYKGIRSDFCSKPTPIHGLVNRSEFYYSSSRSHFSWLSQELSKELDNFFSPKGSYYYMTIDPVINRFCPNEVIIHFCVCGHSIITFGENNTVSNTSHVDSFYRFRKTVVDKIKLDRSIL